MVSIPFSKAELESSVASLSCSESAVSGADYSSVDGATRGLGETTT
jgi:hypothetical protein